MSRVLDQAFDAGGNVDARLRTHIEAPLQVRKSCGPVGSEVVDPPALAHRRYENPIRIGRVTRVKDWLNDSLAVT